MNSLIKKAFFFSFFLTLFILDLNAQNSFEVSGKINDQNNSSIAGAQINLSGAVRRSTVTDAQGNFSFQNLPPGEYDLKISADGFAAVSQKFSLTNQNRNFDIALEIAASQTTVTAEIGSEVERSNVPQAITIINSNELLDRSSSVIAQVAAEEVGLNVQTTSPTIGAIVVRGLTGKNVVNYIDGIRFTNSGQRGGINTFFNLNDASNLQSIEVLRGPNSAQYGSDSLAGTVNLLSKSGIYGADKAEFHGDVNTFFNSANRSLGGSAFLSYGTQRLGGYVNVFGRKVGELRTAGELDSHSSITRFLGLPSDILYTRNPETGFSQYGGMTRLNFAPTDASQFVFQYLRSQQDDGKRFDQLVGGDGNLIADLRNLMLDFGYVRYVKQNPGIFDSGSFTFSYNSQREERVNQGGQGNPFGTITHQYERTTATGIGFFVDKRLSFRNSFLFGGDFYRERINSPAFTFDPLADTSFLSRPRIPDEAKFNSGGLYIQNAWEAIPNRLRITGAARYSAAVYKVRASDSPVVRGFRLWNDDSLREGGFSSRIGAVVRIVDELRVAFNYSRGFRYPSMTDLGTLGLTGDGFEIDYLSAINLGGTIGTTANAAAVSTGIPVSKQRSEISNNFDASLRWTKKRFDTELTVFRLDINDSIVKQALILPDGVIGQFLGDQPITNRLSNGVVFVGLSTAPVLVRANYTDAKIFGFEYELESQFADDFKFQGNFTYIRAEDKATGAPPNIEGGTPPATGFLSLKYAPAGRRFWIEAYSTLAARQERLSTLDLGDRRTGAARSRSQIANFIRRGACVRGLTVNTSGTGCGAITNNYVLTATGETLQQVQNRLLPLGATINGVFVAGNDTAVPLFTYLPGYGLFNLRGGFRIGERSQIFVAFENIFDKQYRNPSWGIDGAGRNLRVAYRLNF